MCHFMKVEKHHFLLDNNVPERRDSLLEATSVYENHTLLDFTVLKTDATESQALGD